MKEWIWKILGLPVVDLQEVVAWKFLLQNKAAFGWFVILALVFLAGAVFSYWKSPIQLSRGRKVALLTVRCLFLAALLLLFLKPSVVLTLEGQLKGQLFLLIDSSSSMRVKDARFSEDDKKRSAMAQNFIPAKKGLNQAYRPGKNEEIEIDRLTLARRALANDKLDLISRLEKKFNVTAMQFSESLLDIAPSQTNQPGILGGKPKIKNLLEQVEPNGQRTAMGTALEELVDRKRGQTISGVVLVTDGANNSGPLPTEVAAKFRENGTPLYIYGVGITSPRDVQVSQLVSPELGFVKDDLAVTVNFRSQSLPGEKGTVQLFLGKEKVAEKEVTFSKDEEQSVQLQFTPKTPGDFQMVAKVPARFDESNKENNETAQRIKILDSKIKVLLVEQTPRWEYRYLQAMLLRDRRIELKCFLIEGDKAITRAPNSPYIEKFPATREELFKYDLILLGDVDPKNFSRTQLEYVQEFVSKFGGAVIALAGARHMPWEYKGSPIEKIFPVEFEGSVPQAPPLMNRPISVELTPSGKSSQMLTIADDSESNLKQWQSLPPIFWSARVGRAKPAAEVLLVDGDPLKATALGKMPLMAMQQFGVGHVLFIGTDNTWRWRKNNGEKLHQIFWGQVLQRMALQRLLGGAKRTQISTDKKSYQPGERISVFARLYTSGFEPMVEETVKGEIKTKNGRTEIFLRRMPEQPGVYRGELLAPSPEYYSLNVSHDPQTAVQFEVVQPKFEVGDVAMNQPLLHEMAQISGGGFFREEDLDRLPEAIVNTSKKVRTQAQIDISSSFPYFLLLILLISVEWILRKRAYLK